MTNEKKEKIKNALKGSLGIIVNGGVCMFMGNLTGTLITKTGMKLADSILTGIGASALSLYISGKVEDEQCKTIDQIFEAIDVKKEETDEHTGEGDVSTELS